GQELREQRDQVEHHEDRGADHPGPRAPEPAPGELQRRAALALLPRTAPQQALGLHQEAPLSVEARARDRPARARTVTLGRLARARTVTRGRPARARTGARGMPPSVIAD